MDYLHLLCGLSGHDLQRRRGPYGAFWGCAGYPDHCSLTVDGDQVKQLAEAIEEGVLQDGSVAGRAFTITGARRTHHFQVIQESDAGLTVQVTPVPVGPTRKERTAHD